MYKQMIHELRGVAELSMPMKAELLTRAADALERIDAERGKDATAWRIIDKSGETLRLSERSADVRFCQAEGFPSVPLFLSPVPTIPEGMALVSIGAIRAAFIAGFNSVVTYNDAVVVDQDKLADEYAAAQGERK